MLVAPAMPGPELPPLAGAPEPEPDVEQPATPALTSTALAKAASATVTVSGWIVWKIARIVILAPSIRTGQLAGHAVLRASS
jgi:hypothetical protein